MYRLTLITAILLITISAFGQRRAQYVHPDFKTVTSSHSKIAILPMNASIDFRPATSARMSDEEFEQLKLDFSYASQFDLESYFLNRKGKKGFKTSIQDVDVTNKILEENGINFYNMIEYTGEELAKILGVDAVLTGHLAATQPNSEDVAATVEILFDIPLNTNASVIHLKLVDNQGEVLWKYRNRFAMGLGSDLFTPSIPLFRKAARKLPYGRI